MMRKIKSQLQRWIPETTLIRTPGRGDESAETDQRLEHQNGSRDEQTNLFCLPAAARPSNFSMSALVSVSKALIAPEKFSVIRLGVTDLGKGTVPFFTRNDERMST